jgi:transposase
MEFIADVYQTDRIAKEIGMNSLERLKLHQCFSTPVMAALKSWLDQQMDEHLVEPNSSLGKAINYMLNHWTELTRFCSVEGAPLDNNINELILKLPIRNRKNAMFYKTEHGALIGDILMSVIYTTSMAGGNPLDYLITIQQHRSQVVQSPEAWLPWNYQQNLS